MDKTFIKAYITKAKDNKYTFLASTSAIDRQGDSIDQKGWELENFKNNPVVLWAHKYDELPIGKVVDISFSAKGMEVEIVFASEEANPKAQQIKQSVDEGNLSALSVGFIGKQREGNIITVAELLEISVVPVPANQEAILLSKEIDESFKKEVKEILIKEEGDGPEIPEDIDLPEEEVNEDIEEIVEPVVEEKSGRVISNKNRKALESTRDAMKSALSEIEKLLAIEVATTEDEQDEKSNIVVISRSVVEDLKYQLRTENKSNDKLLSILKTL